MVKSFYTSTFFAQGFILDVCQGSEYASMTINNIAYFFIKNFIKFHSQVLFIHNIHSLREYLVASAKDALNTSLFCN